MSVPSVLSEVRASGDGKILEICLNRPEVHNAVDGPTAAILGKLWTQFRDDDSLSVAILHGAGSKSFCAGADLKGLAGLADLGGGTEAPQSLRGGPMGGTRIVQSKPVITVTQGYTYAGGLELYCHGHIRVAEPAGSFSVACRRWGVPLVDGGTVYLPRLLGWGAALPLIITGERINATRAQQIGLVWELVEAGKGLERARRIAEQLCELPQDCLRADLRSALDSWHLPLSEALDREGENLAPVMTSASTQAGLEGFLQGRRFWFE